MTGFHECPVWSLLKKQSKCKTFLRSRHAIFQNALRLRTDQKVLGDHLEEEETGQGTTILLEIFL